jgi:hypothetical protein
MKEKITAATCGGEIESLPIDMRDAVVDALESGRESVIDYYRDESTHYVYFPRSMRGGVCQGGQTDWTDCTSMDDLIDRWSNYDDRWSN